MSEKNTTVINSMTKENVTVSDNNNNANTSSNVSGLLTTTTTANSSSVVVDSPRTPNNNKDIISELQLNGIQMKRIHSRDNVDNHSTFVNNSSSPCQILVFDCDCNNNDNNNYDQSSEEGQ
ncbi:hypothetical protein ABK040_006388 [Willaertia magna]